MEILLKPVSSEKNNIIPSPATKMYLKMLSTEVVCCMEMLMPRITFGIKSNRVNLYQTVHRPILINSCLLQRRFKSASSQHLVAIYS